jgi:hypothetical protein
MCFCDRGWDGEWCSDCSIASDGYAYVCAPWDSEVPYVLIEVKDKQVSKYLRGGGFIPQTTHDVDGVMYNCECLPVDTKKKRDSSLESSSLNGYMEEYIQHSRWAQHQIRQLSSYYDRHVPMPVTNTWLVVGIIFIVLFIITLIMMIVCWSRASRMKRRRKSKKVGQKINRKVSKRLKFNKHN